MKWTIDEDRRDVDLLDCSDSLRPLLEVLPVHPRGYDWDGIVKDNVPGPYRPGSVDFILETGGSIDFIEFKGGDICKPRILENLRVKAADTSLVFDRFFPSDGRGVEPFRHLIVVYCGDFGGFHSYHADPSRVVKILSKYAVRDVHGNRIYYDDVSLMTVPEFGLYLESRFPVEHAS